MSETHRYVCKNVTCQTRDIERNQDSALCRLCGWAMQLIMKGGE